MDTEGWIPIATIATFNRVKSLSMDLNLIRSALHRSTELDVDGDLVRRRGDWIKWVLPTARAAKSKPPLTDEASSLLQQAAAQTQQNHAAAGAVVSDDGSVPLSSDVNETLAPLAADVPHQQSSAAVPSSASILSSVSNNVGLGDRRSFAPPRREEVLLSRSGTASPISM